MILEKQTSNVRKVTITIILQIAVVLLAVTVLAILIRAPLTEGRAANMDLISIYADPFILYGYATSMVFFIGLQQVYKLLGYIRQPRVLEPNAAKALMNIRHCAIAFCLAIIIAGIYIRIFQASDDDPAGFLAICIVVVFASITVATVAAKFEMRFRNVMNGRQEEN